MVGNEIAPSLAAGEEDRVSTGNKNRNPSLRLLCLKEERAKEKERGSKRVRYFEYGISFLLKLPRRVNGLICLIA